MCVCVFFLMSHICKSEAKKETLVGDVDVYIVFFRYDLYVIISFHTCFFTGNMKFNVSLAK